MDPITTATLGDEDFPPKNGVIIKQGALFIQESRRILFMKWKVWRKRWITLRYLSKSTPSVLQIDARSTVAPSSLLLNLTPTTSVEIVDVAGMATGPQQDLAGAKVLQLQLDEHSEPVIFKHASLDEMSDWIAAFRLTVALGETGSICSDTDNSSSWAGSQAAPSPVSSESPVHTFTFDPPVSYVLRIRPCSILSKFGLLPDSDYELRLDQNGLSLHDEKRKETNTAIAHWHLPSLRKIDVDQDGSAGISGKENSKGTVTIHIALEEGISEEGTLVVQTGEATSLAHRLTAAIAAANNGFVRKPFSLDQRESTTSRSSKRRPGSDRPKKRPIMGLMKQHSRLSTDMPSPVSVRAPYIHREMSLTKTAGGMVGRRDLSHTDSRDSTRSSIGNETFDLDEMPESLSATIEK
ncbi:hypothetical protein BV898_00675 [Hypsibius exemplaris]|uniref:PH domain-containing protein n=1 Tax=Hypsibius exemplaris TaxID=2072580 RepID=A0A1W0XE66_HYPEX|nr:hypothetical protein BV898_00675 [Hypsibius exemplaris]